MVQTEIEMHRPMAGLPLVPNSLPLSHFVEEPALWPVGLQDVLVQVGHVRLK